MSEKAMWNGARFDRASTGGHYESWFQRANHPERPLAFWIRYTIFRPAASPASAVGELWAIYSDGERGRISAAKEVVPLDRCRFATSGIDVAIGSAVLDDEHLQGRASGRDHDLAWSLRYAGAASPLLLLPRDLYERGFPKAKALVGTPGADFDGTLGVDGETID